MHETVVDRVDAPGDHHVALTGGQFHNCQVDGTQTAGAGCVHHTVGAAQVKSVADAAGDHVAQQAGERIFLPGDVAVGNIVDDGRFLVFGETLVFEGSSPKRVPQAGSQGDNQLLGTGDPEDNGGVLAVEFTILGVSSVGQGGFRHHQSQQLGGVCGFQGVGRDAELGRVEGYGRQKPTPVAIDVVGCFGIGIVKVVELEMARRWVADTIDAVEQVAPKDLDILGLGEHAGHADDGDCWLRGWG